MFTLEFCTFCIVLVLNTGGFNPMAYQPVSVAAELGVYLLQVQVHVASTGGAG